ncbi:hypothetical protein CLV75_0097 [Ruegeria conchae]|uniref:Uncharacterized protein n=1 Tax=Ruegeria conchae TaxID=981384 RepID=A0A497ZQS2_9RHOB|nr:hypothetical protein CLV75_0097 [Ruegeria conchae]
MARKVSTSDALTRPLPNPLIPFTLTLNLSSKNEF